MMNAASVDYTSGWRRYTLMAPPLFLLMLSAGLTDIVFSDMITHYTCLSLSDSLKVNKTYCDYLHEDSIITDESLLKIEMQVYPYANHIISCDFIIDGIISASWILFLGAWCDIYGRKPLLVMGCLATALHCTLLAILNCFTVDPWIFMIVSMFSTLLGGGDGLIVATTCYIIDITSITDRSWHLACLEAAIMAGVTLGSLLGSLIFQQCGYIVLFSIAAVFSIIAFVYITFYVPETVEKEENMKFGNPLDLRLVIEFFKASLKKRPELNRCTLWNCIFVLSLFVIFLSGDEEISYSFVNSKIGWTLEQFSVYEFLSVIITIIGTIIGLKLAKEYFGVTDIKQALIGCLSGLMAMIIVSFTSNAWHLYLAACASLFTGMISPIIYSILSTSAPPEDIGKIFSMAIFVESLAPLGTGFLYTFISSYYMTVYPSPVHLISAGIFFLMMLPLIYINWKTTRDQLVYEEHIQID